MDNTYFEVIFIRGLIDGTIQTIFAAPAIKDKLLDHMACEGACGWVEDVGLRMEPKIAFPPPFGYYKCCGHLTVNANNQYIYTGFSVNGLYDNEDDVHQYGQQGAKD